MPGASQPGSMIGVPALVHRHNTSAPRTASSMDATARAPGRRAASSRASSNRSDATRTSRKSRTRGTTSKCARPCTPAPTMARVAASFRASSRVERAAAPAVRQAVM